MNHPLAALALVALAMVVLGGLFADAEQEIEDPRTWEPSDWLVERAQDIDADSLPDLQDPRVDLGDVTLPKDLSLELPEGTIVDGNIIELVEDLELELPEGAEIHEFSMDLDDRQGFQLPPGTRVEDGKLVFPPGSILRSDDGTVLPMPEGGTLEMPGYSDAELRRMVDDGYADAPAGSRLEAPVVESPGDWPLTLPAGSRFLLPFLTGLPQGPLAEDTPVRLPAGTRAEHGGPGTGGDGTGGAGDEGGSGDTGGTTPSYSQEARTTTEITGWSETVRKDEPFDVEGHVHRADGTGLAGARVQVFINETKDTPGRHVGGTTTQSDGTWLARVRFPEDLPPADYQLVARHDGTVVDDTYHLPSWSDPPFSVRDSAELVAETPTRTGSGTPTTLQARLADSYGVPIQDATVRLRIEGLPSAKTATTGSDGRATFAHVFDATGDHVVSFHFDGDDNLDPAETETTVLVTDLGFRPDGTPPYVAFLGQTLFVNGTLTENGAPDHDGRATVRFLDEGVVVRGAGTADVTLSFKIPPETTLGRHVVRITRGEGLATTTLEIPVDVKAVPHVAIDDGFYGWFLEGTVPTLSGHVQDAATERPLVDVRVRAENGADGRIVEATTDADGTFRVALPVTQTHPGTVKVSAMPDGRTADPGRGPVLDTAPVRLVATTDDPAVRGVRSPIALHLTATDPTGADRPDVASATQHHRRGPDQPGSDGFGPVRITLGTTTTQTQWQNATPVFSLTVPRTTEPGTYTGLLETPFADEALHVPITVLRQAILTTELPATHDDGPLTFTARLRADDGTPLAGHPVTAAYRSAHGDGALQGTTDDTGHATFTLPASAFGANLRLTLTSPGTDSVAPATTTHTIEHPLGLAVPLLVVLVLFLVAAAVVGYRRAKHGQGRIKKTLGVFDPRPPLKVSIDPAGRPEGLPLAVAPDTPVTVRVRSLGVTTARTDDGAEAPRRTPRRTPVDGSITLHHAGTRQTLAVTKEGATLTVPPTPLGDHVMRIEAEAGRDHRRTTCEKTLHVAPWPDHFAREYTTLLATAQAHIPTLAEGCTPRLLETGLLAVSALPRPIVHRVVDAYEAARFGPRPPTEAEWVTFATDVRTLVGKIERLAPAADAPAPAVPRDGEPAGTPRGRRSRRRHAAGGAP